MNVAEYISTGVLEAYALDQLSPGERARVEHLMNEHAEIKEELALVEATLEALAQSTAVHPKTDLKGTILQEAEKAKEAPVISLDQQTGRSWSVYAAAASVVVAICASFLAYTFWEKWQEAEGQLSEVLVQNQVVAEDYNMVNQRLGALQQSLSIMNDRGYARVELQATENAPGALATVYHNPETSKVFLSIQQLSQLSREQQYQLWAIIDGKPVDAGVFDLSEDALLIPMKPIGSGVAAFAVTIEPAGGSESPSLETMQVIGNA